MDQFKSVNQIQTLNSSISKISQSLLIIMYRLEIRNQFSENFRIKDSVKTASEILPKGTGFLHSLLDSKIKPQTVVKFFYF